MNCNRVNGEHRERINFSKFSNTRRLAKDSTYRGPSDDINININANKKTKVSRTESIESPIL